MVIVFTVIATLPSGAIVAGTFRTLKGAQWLIRERQKEDNVATYTICTSQLL